MRIFQYIAIAIIATLIITSVRNLIRRPSKLPSILWLIVWCGAGAALLNPDNTTIVARALGIERGADLVFYSAVMFGLIGFFLVYQRLRKIDRQMTLLVRKVAIQNAEQPKADHDIDRDLTTDI